MAKQKPNLIVISGGAKPAPPWLRLRPTIVAPSPMDKNQPVVFRIALHDVHKAMELRRRQPVFDLWSVVIGEPPPVPGVLDWEGNRPYGIGLTSLAEAHACFRGIRRPTGTDDDGSGMVAYVLRPRAHFVYEPHMVTVARRMSVPTDLVFVCYVRLDVPTDGPPDTKGVLTHWHFIEATVSAAGEFLPVNHEGRYVRRLW